MNAPSACAISRSRMAMASAMYDFGDDWQHQLVLEAKLVSAPQSLYPACIAGERNSPPEDVGGVDGYADFLDAIANPEHEEHDATLEWVAEISIRKRSQ